ncbi:tripartite tricarboxylate transporter permease [Anaerotruncus colihominis]|uniref:Tripartite tricarboxylate transporter permease n=1 Tax=Anaerotruncus colihominis TaxID=169435 RepID=A0A845SS10_9FIRM|nr:tripartite tricarboxylate transporter permease [Anaerotruncus colihominis]
MTTMQLWGEIFSTFSPMSIVWVTAGVIWGIFGGALPGVTASLAMSLIMPFTIALEPVNAFMLLAATYVGAEYGGSVPAILLGVPGTPANAPTALDGRQLRQLFWRNPGRVPVGCPGQDFPDARPFGFLRPCTVRAVRSGEHVQEKYGQGLYLHHPGRYAGQHRIG